MTNPAIVVITYNRPNSLDRILKSLSQADYSDYENINLIISIDGGGGNLIIDIAEQYNWVFGEKIIIRHDINLGLKKHIISCGDLVDEYNSLIILEDDLYVSPEFYNYAHKAGNFFCNDERIAGIALFAPIYNEISLTLFNPVNDGFDNYFMQVPCSWGQLWTKNQWEIL